MCDHLGKISMQTFGQQKHLVVCAIIACDCPANMSMWSFGGNIEHVLGVQGAASPFRDNDGLAALLAVELQADLLVLLTDVDGLYTGPPTAESSL